jgi:hypothetical protein
VFTQAPVQYSYNAGKCSCRDISVGVTRGSTIAPTYLGKSSVTIKEVSLTLIKVVYVKPFLFSLTLMQNKPECLSLASFLKLLLYFKANTYKQSHICCPTRDVRDVRDIRDLTHVSVYEFVYCIRTSSSTNKYTKLRLYEPPLIRTSAPPLTGYTICLAYKY